MSGGWNAKKKKKIKNMGIIKKVSSFLDVVKKISVYAKASVSAIDAFTAVLEENGMGAKNETYEVKKELNDDEQNQNVVQ